MVYNQNSDPCIMQTYGVMRNRLKTSQLVEHEHNRCFSRQCIVQGGLLVGQMHASNLLLAGEQLICQELTLQLTVVRFWSQFWCKEEENHSSKNGDWPSVGRTGQELSYWADEQECLRKMVPKKQWCNRDDGPKQKSLQRRMRIGRDWGRKKTLRGKMVWFEMQKLAITEPSGWQRGSSKAELLKRPWL